MIRLVLWLWAGWQALRPVEGQPCPWCGRTGAGEPQALEREMAALRRELREVPQMAHQAILEDTARRMGSALNRPDDEDPPPAGVRA